MRSSTAALQNFAVTEFEIYNAEPNVNDQNYQFEIWTEGLIFINPELCEAKSLH